ncbi:MAG: 50S ribosomal protein L10 [Terriglobales bacterium]|jgi:large subunit ribosomal protein L10
MALTKAQKQTRIDSLQQQLAGASTLIVTGFSGLTVAQDLELRRTLRAAGGRFRVIKNTLAQRASQGSAAAGVLSDLRGINAIAYTSGDGVALAKALLNWAKDNPALEIHAGVVEGAAINKSGVAQLAATPSKEELYSKLLYLLQAPAQRLVTVLNANGRNTAVVLDQAVKANKFAS